MPAVHLDSDVDSFLRALKRATGLDESSLIRQAFDLPAASSRSAAESAADPVAVSLRQYIQSQRFVSGADARNATTRFLGLLSHLYRRHPDRFEAVLQLGGRSRRYFGRTREEVLRSGTHTAPKPIPESPYWVMTNAATAVKRQVIANAMGVLGYSTSDTAAASQALR